MPTSTVSRRFTVIVKKLTLPSLAHLVLLAFNSKPPHRENARVERYILTLRQLSIATLSSLPYILPPKYTLFHHKAIAHIMNSRSYPSTPNELLQGTKPKHRIFPFGACCMVTQHLDKRIALAQTHKTSAATEAKTEIGVCMGYDPVTGRTLFVLANGSIVPRRPTAQLPATYVLFNWTPKTFIIDTMLPKPSSLPPLNPSTTNSVIHPPSICSRICSRSHLPPARQQPP